MSEDFNQARHPKRSRIDELKCSVENVFQYPVNPADTKTAFQDMGNAIHHIGNAITAMGCGPPGGIVGSGGGIAGSDGSIEKSILIEFQVDDNFIIAKGSNGNLFLDGIHDRPDVVVKRLARSHADIDQEILASIKDLRHENIVKFHGLMCKQDYMYLAVERCQFSLHDLIQAHSNSSAFPHDPPLSDEYKKKLESVKKDLRSLPYLWTDDGYPTSDLKNLMRNVVSGLKALHRLGFTHADLKPQNVMITVNNRLHAKLSDVGIKKHPRGDRSSNPGTGWQPHEQIGQVGPHAKQVDLFSLGCVLFYCIIPGKHPFGGLLERDLNITRNNMDLSSLQPEARHLISKLLRPQPELRPGASRVLSHTFFWKSKKRLDFLCEFSQCIQRHIKEHTNPDLLIKLERKQKLIFGRDWISKLDCTLKANITSSQCQYNYHLVSDLLRMTRNKWAHKIDLPANFLRLLSEPFPGNAKLCDRFDHYFSITFPRLVMESYNVARQFCSEDNWFKDVVD